MMSFIYSKGVWGLSIKPGISVWIKNYRLSMVYANTSLGGKHPVNLHEKFCANKRQLSFNDGLDLDLWRKYTTQKEHT